MAEKEVKVDKVHFSLPYRSGMEAEAGFTGKAEMVSKTFPDEKVFGKFALPLDASIVVADKEALEYGRKVLQQNKQRSVAIGAMAGKYKIAAPGAAGGITKTDKGLISAMGLLTTDHAKIAKAFKIKTSKDITLDEVKEILAG